MGKKERLMMDITESAKSYREKIFPHYQSEFAQNDPELIERLNNFAFDEVVNSDDLNDKTRLMAIVASLIGCQTIGAYKVLLPAVLKFGVAPVEI